MTLFLLVIQAAAVTVVFTRGSIFEWLRGEPCRARHAEAPIVRLFRDWASCALCSGVWIGGFFYAVHTTPMWAYYSFWLQVLGFGSMVGVLALLVSSLIDWLQGPAPPEDCGQESPGA